MMSPAVDILGFTPAEALFWMRENLTTWTAAWQIAATGVLILAAAVLAHASAVWTEKHAGNGNGKRRSLLRLNVSMDEGFFLVYTALLLGMAYKLAQAVGVHAHILKKQASAWPAPGASSA